MPGTPTLFVTGTSVQRGGLVVDEMLREVTADAVVAGVRNIGSDAASALRAKGVQVREADYNKPETLASAFSGVDRLLLVSSSDNGKRHPQHSNVIAAARDAGVGPIAYTSILHADTTPLMLAEEHRDTEAALVEAKVRHVLLRNGWYTEVYTGRLPAALKAGVLPGAAEEGRLSAAARADYAEAATVVLAGGDHADRTYELAGDRSFTLAELAAVVSQASGKSLSNRDMKPEMFRSVLIDAGLPEMAADIVSDTDAGVVEDPLLQEGGDLRRLIGRPTTPHRETITHFVRKLLTSERVAAQAA